MLQKKTDRVLICLPDGRWLALSADVFREALQSGAELAAASVCAAVPEHSSEAEAALAAASVAIAKGEYAAPAHLRQSTNTEAVDSLLRDAR